MYKVAIEGYYSGPGPLPSLEFEHIGKEPQSHAEASKSRTKQIQPQKQKPPSKSHHNPDEQN